MMSAGTAVSTALAGWTADRFGRIAAFRVFAAAGVAAVVLVTVAMPETRQKPQQPADDGMGSANAGTLPKRL